MREDWNVQDFAIAIAKDDKVLMTKGYGVRELGKTDKVDENTCLQLLQIQRLLRRRVWRV